LLSDFQWGRMDQIFLDRKPNFHASAAKRPES
jgi:hypothetical protein